MMVPDVPEVCMRQPAHSKAKALVSGAQALMLPQFGQTKPSGQRVSMR
jgi:hypothetical protein